MVQHCGIQLPFDGQPLFDEKFSDGMRAKPAAQEGGGCLPSFRRRVSTKDPPERPRPPAGTCALTITGPRSDAIPAAWSGLVATAPGGVVMLALRNRNFALFSSRFNAATTLFA